MIRLRTTTLYSSPRWTTLLLFLSQAYLYFPVLPELCECSCLCLNFPPHHLLVHESSAFFRDLVGSLSSHLRSPKRSAPSLSAASSTST